MGITEYNNYLKNKRDDIMKEAQRPSDKEAKKIYDIEKTMALTIFKKYWPDVIIDLTAKTIAEVIEEVVVVEPEGPTEEELLAKAHKEEIAIQLEVKAKKKAELEAQLKALDES